MNALEELRIEVERLKSLDNKNNPHTTLKLQLEAMKKVIEAISNSNFPTQGDELREWWKIKELLDIK